MLVPILSFCCYIDLFCISVGGVVVEKAPSTTCNIIVTRCKCIDLKAMEHVNQRLVVFHHIVRISHSHTCVSEFINSPYLSAIFCHYPSIRPSTHPPPKPVQSPDKTVPSFHLFYGRTVSTDVCAENWSQAGLWLWGWIVTVVGQQVNTFCFHFHLGDIDQGGDTRQHKYNLLTMTVVVVVMRSFDCSKWERMAIKWIITYSGNK